MFDPAPGLPRESDTHRDARELLACNGFPALKIIRVNPDSILYLTPARKVATGWIYLVNERARVFCEPGMPPYPTVPLPNDHPDFEPLDPPEYDNA